MTPELLLAEMGEPLSLDAYDWDLAIEYPLAAEDVFPLTYAAQVEWATEDTFAKLNVADDPTVREFLRVWLDQEVAHAQLLCRVLAASGHPVELLHLGAAQRFRQMRTNLINRLAITCLGRDFFGVHMSWGAVNELTTLRFYALMRERTQHPLLQTLLHDIMRQETLHYNFYRASAVQQLADNPRGQRITRFVMDHIWKPVGTGLHEDGDVERVFDQVFAPHPEQVAKMDNAINRIPGLADLDCLARALV